MIIRIVDSEVIDTGLSARNVEIDALRSMNTLSLLSNPVESAHDSDMQNKDIKE